jgi:hypothetical protein
MRMYSDPMRAVRLSLFIIAAGLVLSSCGTSATPAAEHSVPILGYPRASRSTGTQGWGTIRPKNIFNGGDPSGLVKDISWSSWGGARALGKGMGFEVPSTGPVSAGHFASAVVVAFDLGTCDKHWSYLRVRWYFHGHNPKLLESTKFESTCNNYSSSKYV